MDELILKKIIIRMKYERMIVLLTRVERDSLGEIEVERNKYWGAQTERSKQNFPIGQELMPSEIIHAFAILKRSAATANAKLKLIKTEQKQAIHYATDRILNHELEDHFPLVVWQTGSGTQSNMNINEVIAHVGNEWLEKNNIDCRLHPNDDVNKSQSSNDTYPTAMYIAFVLKIEKFLIPAIESLYKSIHRKSIEYDSIIKIGRTHFQDATPITLGQEMSGWGAMLQKCKGMIKMSLQELKELAIGGTAVGTGLNTHPDFSNLVCEEISLFTNILFTSSKNKFHSLTSYDEAVFTHGAIKALAGDLLKITNDIRFLASGPRSGIGEITIPTNEPGSSIMPGKVNPTQCEALSMVCIQVMGNDTSIGIAASQGHLELNVYKPVIAYNFLQSCELLTDAINSFNERTVMGIEPNKDRIEALLNESLMLVTALNPHIGYEKSAEIAKKAHTENKNLREVAIELGYLTNEEFEKYVQPEKMAKPHSN